MGNNFSGLGLTLGLFLEVICFMTAYFDWRYRRIPLLLLLAFILGGLAFALINADPSLGDPAFCSSLPPHLLNWGANIALGLLPLLVVRVSLRNSAWGGADFLFSAGLGFLFPLFELWLLLLTATALFTLLFWIRHRRLLTCAAAFGRQGPFLTVLAPLTAIALARALLY